MNEVKWTLIADGSSDKTLMKVIKWLFDDLFPTIPNAGTFADFRRLPNPPKNLREKIDQAKTLFPFEILFVHRDTESKESEFIQKRKNEIVTVLTDEEKLNTICVIPSKMMESWLLIDSEAIKKAAGNRNYSREIDLPKINKIEQLSDPKNTLHGLLKLVSGLKGRGLEKFNPNEAVHYLADYIEDYGKLRGLSSFDRFESDFKETMDRFHKT